MKHIETDQHFVKQKIEDKVLTTYIRSHEQVADIFTKWLNGQHFWTLKHNILNHAQFEWRC